MDKLEPVAELVRKRRGDKSIRTAAKEIGISPTTLSKVERGHLPDMKTLRSISAWLQLAPDSMLAVMYALPSTHRIVSVELLEACMRECYMPEDNLRDRIGAIIDQETANGA